MTTKKKSTTTTTEVLASAEAEHTAALADLAAAEASLSTTTPVDPAVLASAEYTVRTTGARRDAAQREHDDAEETARVEHAHARAAEIAEDLKSVDPRARIERAADVIRAEVEALLADVGAANNKVTTYVHELGALLGAPHNQRDPRLAAVAAEPEWTRRWDQGSSTWRSMVGQYVDTIDGHHAEPISLNASVVEAIHGALDGLGTYSTMTFKRFSE